MTKSLLTTFLWTGLCLAALADGTPKLQFDQTLYDFGKTSQVTTVAGVFKFKNTGDGILKLEPPQPSCGCTIAELKPNTLAPGATGELAFTLNLGLSRSVLEKHIAIKSNDPQTPEVGLTIKVDYTPPYELDPLTLAPTLAFGIMDNTQFATLTRTDGKPLHIVRLDGSQPWITATVEPSAKADEATARIRVVIQREGLPRRFNESVQVYASEQTNTPVSSIALYGQVMGEVSLTPESLYWSISDASKPGDRSTQRVTIRSANGQTFDLKNPQSTIKGIKLELVPKEAGKVYELVARLEEVPQGTVAGNISLETSVAAQSRIEVPVIINVFKP